jgi:hypothetical protein
VLARRYAVLARRYAFLPVVLARRSQPVDARNQALARASQFCIDVP